MVKSKASTSEDITVIKFAVAGPYEIPFRRSKNGSGKRIDKHHAKEFWDDEPSEYAMKQGCYVFGLSVSGSYKPWYVGRTKASMKGECFNTTNLDKYNHVVFDNKGTPVMFFVIRRDGRKVVPYKVLSQLEVFLIQAAKIRNDHIVNVHHTKNLPRWGISGIIRGGPGENTNDSEYFRVMMGL